MKNIYYIILISLGLTYVNTSCTDLEQEPQSAISPDNFLLEEAHLAMYANGMYNDILPGHNGYFGLFGIDDATDNMSSKSLNVKYVPGEWKVPQNDNSNWNFTNIRSCNYFLENVLPKYEAGSIKGSANNIKHYIGEVYFLRAYQYFTQYQKFGDFPIVTAVLPDDMTALTEASKRSPRNEVARFILSDLDKAIELMATTPDSRKTRINKESAILLKSRVALYEGTFLKYFKGTAFVPNGNGWPGASKDYNKDYKYPSGSIDSEIEYFLTQAMDASKLIAEDAELTDNTGELQKDASSPNNPYYDMFATADLSGYKEVLLWREYSQAVSVTHYVCNSMRKGSIGLTRGMVDGFLMKNGLPIYNEQSGYQGDDSIAATRIDRDTRLSIFLKSPGDRLFLYGTPVGNISVPDYEILPDLFAAGVSGFATGYSIRKGLSVDKSNLGGYGDRCYTGAIIFRATEALLNYIEASYEKNGRLDETAIKYWKEIRKRSKIDEDINKTIQATDMSIEAKNDWGAYSAGNLLTDPTLYNIRRERRCELMCEGLRWMDLQRWRSLDQMISTPYHIEGFKLWGPMQHWYDNTDGTSKLITGLDNKKANVSSKELSQYLRPFEILGNSLAVNGYKWQKACYLYPIAIQNMLITSQDNDVSTSPLYQNPYWPSVANEGAVE